MLFTLTKRVLTEANPKVVAKFVYNFGVKGIRSVELHKRRRRRGENFPPFLFISIISSCQLRCQGCWVDVASPTQKMSLDELNRIVGDAKAHGNAYFGILGGEPFLHPDLLDLFAAHPDCYFQVFTNGQLITDDIAQQLARLGNVTPLVSIEGSEIVSDERRGRTQVLTRTLEGLEACRRHGLLIGVATSVCQTNVELVSEAWLRRLIQMGVHYVWFHTYRVVGSEAQSSARAQAGTGVGGAPLHRADACAAADRDRRCVLGRPRRGALPDGDRRQPSHRARRAHRALPGHSVRDQHRPRWAINLRDDDEVRVSS